MRCTEAVVWRRNFHCLNETSTYGSLVAVTELGRFIPIKPHRLLRLSALMFRVHTCNQSPTFLVISEENSNQCVKFPWLSGVCVTII
ncbi:hypothetical protein K1719_014677 [Acacia pycnantha]|nr:hypothetical protein K1719_014677 [Acacia pycnantha]